MDQLTEVAGQGLEQNAGVEIVITNKSGSQVHSLVLTTHMGLVAVAVAIPAAMAAWAWIRAGLSPQASDLQLP